MLMDAPFKVMPHNVEAEQSVLGSMIIDKTSIAQALEVLSREDFYKESHQTLFDTILDLYQKDVAVDLVTITENLQAKEKLRSEEHTSELQSRQYLVCRLLLEKKKRT